MWGPVNRIGLSRPAICFQKANIFLLQHLPSMHWIETAPVEAGKWEKVCLRFMMRNFKLLPK